MSLTTTHVCNMDDVIDSRDIIERIEELEKEEVRNIDEQGELDSLNELAEEADGYTSDWKYGEALIHESYFVEYVEELLKDIGVLPTEIPWYIVIDWDATAAHVKQDYTELDFNGQTYYIRNG